MIDRTKQIRCLLCSKKIASTDRSGYIICLECRDTPPSFDCLLSMIDYGPLAKRSISRAKYDKRYKVAKCLGAQMAFFLTLTAPWVIHGNRTVVPVPLTFLKLAGRGYNQSAVMGKVLSTLSGFTFKNNGLKRVSQHRTQAGSDEDMRKLQVKGAFRVNSIDDIKDRNIILVDDVATTLSTLNECAREIKNANPKSESVIALTAARSV